jgi:putative acetyltransferase
VLVELLVVEPGDPRAADVRALLERHLAFANEHSPPEDVHALDLDGLLDPAIVFFTARRGDLLVGTGALKVLEDHAEIKSMHTGAESRGQGVARAVLDRLLAEARARGCSRVSLETGSMDAFAPARTLYERTGFTSCEPFGDYVASEYSTFMTLELADVPTPATGRTGDSPATG